MTKFRFLVAAILLGLVGYANADGIGTTFQISSSMITTALGFTPPSNALTSTHLLVGNGSNVAADTALSGDSTITNAGVMTNINFHPTVRTVIAAGAITVATTDYIICVNKTSGAATTANLYGSPATGSTVVIKDCKGDASTNNITVTPAAGNIDGSTTFVINSAYGVWRGTYTGAAWSTL